MAASKKKIRILVTAFEPFGGESENASRMMLEAMLDRAKLPRHWKVKRVELPVSYQRAPNALRKALEGFEADVAISFGQARRDGVFRIETLAANADKSPKPDNDGRRGRAKILSKGPSHLKTGLPARALVKRLRERGFTAKASRDAGGYLCNHVFFRLMAMSRGRVFGFVHVPAAPLGADPTAWGRKGAPAIREVLKVCVDTASARSSEGFAQARRQKRPPA